MGNNKSKYLLPPGDSNGPSIQTDDSEMSQERLTNSTYSYSAPPQVENKMMRELKYFFMNPYEKFKARGRKPWKLCIQVLKIFLITAQVSYDNRDFFPFL